MKDLLKIAGMIVGLCLTQAPYYTMIKDMRELHEQQCAAIKRRIEIITSSRPSPSSTTPSSAVPPSPSKEV